MDGLGKLRNFPPLKVERQVCFVFVWDLSSKKNPVWFHGFGDLFIFLTVLRGHTMRSSKIICFSRETITSLDL